LALVDKDIANTLGELARKLRELERVLSGIDGGAGERKAAPPRAQTPGDAFAEPAGASRLVDEAFDREAAHGSVATAATRETPPARDKDAHDRPPPGPLLDGTQPRPAEQAAPAYTGGRRASDFAPVQPTAPSALAGAPERHAVRRPPREADRTPSAAELLRFRDRLERTARELTHDYDELLGRITYATVPTPTGPTISFARGAPSLDIVDVQGLRDAAGRAFESDPAGTTGYGTSVGYPRLRAWIADRHGVDPERVLVTNGSMQADAFLFEHLVRPGDDVIVERPSYDRTLLSLRERGATLHAVELETDGIDTRALSRLLGSGQARPKLAHIIPNFQNPAGYTLSLAKREALLELARQHGFVIFEDDPYVALRFSGESMPTMLSMDAERVVYASSFSKTVCPGIRVGYLVGPPDLIKAIARLATSTYISPNMVAQSIVYEFCASGAIERSIETVRTALAKRVLTLAEALRRELPEAEFVAPEGGYFMWVTLPQGTEVARLFDAAAELGVAFVKGTDFLLEGGENTLRLAFSGVTTEQIDEGVTRLAAAYRSL
jgi:2-aminoadipate transaminase